MNSREDVGQAMDNLRTSVNAKIQIVSRLPEIIIIQRGPKVKSVATGRGGWLPARACGLHHYQLAGFKTDVRGHLVMT